MTAIDAERNKKVFARNLNYYEQTVKIGINTDVFYMTLSK